MKVLRITSRFHSPSPWFRDMQHSELLRKFHTIGGMQSQIYMLAKALSKLDVYQEIITTKPSWNQSIENWDNVRIYRFGLPIPIRRQLYEIPALKKAIQLSTHGFDLVHCHSGEDLAAIPIGLMAAKRAGIPFVLTIHNSWNFTYYATNSADHIRQIIGKRIELLGLQQADAICTLTPKTANLITEKMGIDPQKIFVIPDGTDLAIFNSIKGLEEIKGFAEYFDIPESCNYIVYLGRLVPQKGVLYLLKAAALLRDQGEQFVIIISGDGPERKMLEKETKRLKLSTCIVFTRFIHQDDVPILLSMANIFVLPSVYEEFGSVLLEAMAMRLPVVASKTGGIPEIIRHKKNGLLFQPMDSESLANSISLLLNDQSLAHQLGEQAYRDVQKYDILEIAKNTLNKPYAFCKSMR